MKRLKEITNKKVTVKHNHILSYFNDIVTNFPEYVALVDYNQEEMSYQELDFKANFLAERLVRDEITSVVGILFDRASPHWVISILACWKAGLCFILLEPPSEKLSSQAISFRLTQCTKEGKMKYVISHHDLISRIFGNDPELIAIYYDEPKLNTTSYKINRIKDGDQWAYCMFTSGTTGDPKAMAIPHQGLPFIFESAVEQLKIERKDRILQCTALTFDPCIWDLMLALASGATLVLKDNNAIDFSSFVFYLQNQHINYVTSTPTQFKTIIPFVKKESKLCLKAIISTGEEGSKETFDFWQQHCSVYIGFGSSEEPIGMMLTLYDGNEFRIGTFADVFKGYETSLHNAETKKQQDFGEGELWVSSPGLACGYITRGEINKELTDRYFVNGDLNKRYYKTGDRILIDDNGIFYLKGRIDDQLEINGVRIEPGGLKNKLIQLFNSQNNVKLEEIFINKHTAALSSTLEAYLLVHNISQQQIDFVKDFVKTNNDTRVPVCYFIVERRKTTSEEILATNASDKTSIRNTVSNIKKLHDQNKIFIYDLRSSNKDNDLIDDYEKKVHAEWKKVLNIWQSIAKTENFSDLGGDSFKRTQLNASLGEIFNCQWISLLLKDARTISDQAAVLRRYDCVASFYKNSSINPFRKVSNGKISDFDNKKNPPEQRPVLFCFYPIDGAGTEEYLMLSKNLFALGHTNPFYILRHPYLTLSIEDSTKIKQFETLLVEHKFSFTEMAIYIVECIQQIQPQGPYCFASWSFGGMPAYLVAQLLQYRGETVSFIGLIDAPSPDRACVELTDIDLTGLKQLILSVMRKLESHPNNDLEFMRFQESFIKEEIKSLDELFDYAFNYLNRITNEKQRLEIKRHLCVLKSHLTTRYQDKLPLWRKDTYEYHASEVTVYPDAQKYKWDAYIAKDKHQRRVITGSDHFNILKSSQLASHLLEDLTNSLGLTERQYVIIDRVHALQAQNKDQDAFNACSPFFGEEYYDLLDTQILLADCYLNIKQPQHAKLIIDRVENSLNTKLVYISTLITIYKKNSQQELQDAVNACLQEKYKPLERLLCGGYDNQWKIFLISKQDVKLEIPISDRELINLLRTEHLEKINVVLGLVVYLINHKEIPFLNELINYFRTGTLAELELVKGKYYSCDPKLYDKAIGSITRSIAYYQMPFLPETLKNKKLSFLYRIRGQRYIDLGNLTASESKKEYFDQADADFTTSIQFNTSNEANRLGIISGYETLAEYDPDYYFKSFNTVKEQIVTHYTNKDAVSKYPTLQTLLKKLQFCVGNQKTILHYAAQLNDHKLFKVAFLFHQHEKQDKFPSFLNQTDNLGNLALHYACSHNFSSQVDAMVIDDVEDSDFAKQGKIIDDLVSLGCDIRQKNHLGFTPYHYTLRNGHYDRAIQLYRLLRSEIKYVEWQVYTNELYVETTCKFMSADALVLRGVIDKARRIYQTLLDETTDPRITLLAKQKLGEDILCSHSNNPVAKATYDLVQQGHHTLENHIYLASALLFNSALAFYEKHQPIITIDWRENNDELNHCQTEILAKIAFVETCFIRRHTNEEYPIAISEIIARKRHLIPWQRHIAQQFSTHTSIDEIKIYHAEQLRMLIIDLFTEACQQIKHEIIMNNCAVIGLTCLKRGEVCRFSDIDYMIAVRNPTDRTLIHISAVCEFFHMKIINLGETYPLMNLHYSVNTVAPNNATFRLTPISSFDNSKNPSLNQFPLLDTPYNLAQLLLPKWNHEKELQQTLGETCFIMGDESLWQEFLVERENVLSNSKEEFKSQADVRGSSIALTQFFTEGKSEQPKTNSTSSTFLF